MRDYVPKEYRLQRWVYQTVIATVRGYDSMVKRMHAVEVEVAYAGLCAAAPEAGAKKKKGASRPTESKAELLARRNAEDERRTRAVEQAQVLFDDEERRIIINSIKNGTPVRRRGIRGADRTMERRKLEFVLIIAEKLHLI